MNHDPLAPYMAPLTNITWQSGTTLVQTDKLKTKRKKAGTSPTQRALKHWRALGYVCAIVERWNPHVRIRQDLYGFIDLLAVKGEDIVGVQACSTRVAERVTKITEHANYPLVCKAIRIVVEGYSKNSKGKYVRREVEL